MQAVQDWRLGSVANTPLNTSRQPSDLPDRLARSQENTSREEVASGSEKPCLYFHEATFLVFASAHLFILRLRRGAIWLLKSIHEALFHVIPKLTEKNGSSYSFYWFYPGLHYTEDREKQFWSNLYPKLCYFFAILTKNNYDVYQLIYNIVPTPRNPQAINNFVLWIMQILSNLLLII